MHEALRCSIYTACAVFDMCRGAARKKAADAAGLRGVPPRSSYIPRFARSYIRAERELYSALRAELYIRLRRMLKVTKKKQLTDRRAGGSAPAARAPRDL